jgi:hypothetical protein
VAILAGWAVVSLTGAASPRIENTRAMQVVDRLAPAMTANVVTASIPPAAKPQPSVAQQLRALGYAPAGDAEVATAAEFMAKPVLEAPAASNTTPPVVVAALTDPLEVLPQDIVSAAASAGVADAPPQDTAAAPALPRLEIVGECLVAESCIDQYLFALYERTPKEDTIKEREQRKVTVKRKGKTITVTRSVTRLVDNDFTWKDPKAAERIKMSMIDYVIGGMDKSFKLKLFYMLQAAENAGLEPGITSAFRDDYRQSIAAGLKAASDRSYHGGSTRGGYGRGLAADITSVKGGGRAKRWVSTEALWKWVDANGKKYGIGRPYLDRDPPHVGPIDGPEYISKRGSGTKSADVRKRSRAATHAQQKPAAAKPVTVAIAASPG